MHVATLFTLLAATLLGFTIAAPLPANSGAVDLPANNGAVDLPASSRAVERATTDAITDLLTTGSAGQSAGTLPLRYVTCVSFLFLHFFEVLKLMCV